MITTIVFDLDGTLADSSDCIVEAAHLVAQEFNRPTAEDELIRSQIGKPLDEMLSSLFGLKHSDISRACELYSAEYIRLAPFKERLFDNALELVQELHQAGFKLAIATGKSQNGCR